MQPIAEEDTPEFVEPQEKPFIESEKEMIDDKSEFVPPERQPGEDGRTFNGRVQYERKKFYGEPIRAEQRKRYEPKPELFEKL